MRVYLAGSINGCTDTQAKDWRAIVTSALSNRGFTFLDPMARDYRGREDANTAEIVEGNQADIQSCDLMLAYCWQPSYGTAMEIFYAAHVLRLPVYVVATSPVSPWLRYHASRLFANLGDAIVDLARIGAA